jgi:hypothetical protein
MTFQETEFKLKYILIKELKEHKNINIWNNPFKILFVSIQQITSLKKKYFN